MALKLRLRHALGEATYEFNSHQASGQHPVVIGRGPEASIEVASLRVAPRHCALFFHEGLWVLQDGNSRVGTRVNGSPLPGSRAVWPLSAGDEITLGDGFSSPSLLIEQADRQPIPGLTSVATVRRQPRRPPRKGRGRLTFAPLLLAGLGSLLVIGAGLLSYWWLLPRTMPSRVRATLGDLAPAVPPTTIRVPDEGESACGTTLPAPAPAVSHSRNAVPSTRPSTRPALLADAAGIEGELNGVPAHDSRRQSAAWAEVATAHRQLGPGPRLLAYDRYLAGRPSGDPLHDLVAEWQEETLDELWWRRIKALLDEELALVDRRVAIEAELRLMPPNEQAARASGLRDEQRRIRERLTAIAADLSDQFGYEAGISPNVGNEEQLDRLRQARNADRYRAWQRAVLELVRSSVGKLPWE